jgi:hypothetical protein
MSTTISIIFMYGIHVEIMQKYKSKSFLLDSIYSTIQCSHFGASNYAL